MMPGRAVIRRIWEFMSPTFRAAWYPRFEATLNTPQLKPSALRNTNAAQPPSAITKLTCAPLSRVLPPNLRVVDIWFLDVEGAEANVLRATDFEALQVGIIIKERSADALVELESKLLLRKAGFESVGLDSKQRNAVFVNQCLATHLSELNAQDSTAG